MGVAALMAQGVTTEELGLKSTRGPCGSRRKGLTRTRALESESATQTGGVVCHWP